MPSPFMTADMPCTSGDVITTSDTVPVPGNVRWIRANSAGSVVLRYPGSSADATISAVAGEYIPACPGIIVKTATAVVVHAFGV